MLYMHLYTIFTLNCKYKNAFYKNYHPKYTKMHTKNQWKDNACIQPLCSKCIILQNRIYSIYQCTYSRITALTAAILYKHMQQCIALYKMWQILQNITRFRNAYQSDKALLIRNPESFLRKIYNLLKLKIFRLLHFNTIIQYRQDKTIHKNS